MQDHGLEDELVKRLAETNEDRSPAFDPTLEAISAEIASLSAALKTPPEANPFASEPELAAALERASSLALETPLEPTRTDQASTAAEGERGPKILGQYELQEKLGSGGMGTVYRAVHRKLNRTVALKVLPSDRFQSPDAVARFEREIRAVGMLQHPNIVAAHDAGEVDGCHFLVMELVDGEDIGDLLSRTGPLPIAEACEIVRQAALGLQHIFENGLVHRDIKPSNLMLASPRNRKGEPTVKILDLGLALLDPNQLVAARELTSTGQVMGTVDYMAPEQGLDTHSVDIRADLYSLGATLYKLLTGRAPLEDPRYNSMMKRLIALDRDQPPLMTLLRPDCPLELCEFIHRLLSKSPDQRPEQPQTVADFLTRYAQGADLRALQHGTAETLKRWIVANPEVPTVTTTPQSPTQISKPRPTADDQPPGPPRPARRWLLAAALPVALLLGVLIYVVTDTVQITIEAPDDLKDSVSVSVLRNGAPAVDNWRIEPGPNAHRIRSGTVEVKLAASVDDAFELQPLGDLIVKRGGEVKYRLTRRKLDSAAAKTPSNGSPPKTSSSEIASLPAPIQIDEPPPLEDWLKGRTVLTVAQDGSGQFKTIQAALDALLPGQVVKVLDAGPYRERITASALPKNTGLISEARTVIEVTEWPTASHPHLLGSVTDFRLHGFRFRVRPIEEWFEILSVNGASGLVIENCAFGLFDQGGKKPVNSGIQLVTDPNLRAQPIRVRECVFEGVPLTLGFKALVNATIIIERNFFSRSGVNVGTDAELQTLIVRHNVFDIPEHKYLLFEGLHNVRESLSVLNNTATPAGTDIMIGIAFMYEAPIEKVTIRNNLSNNNVGVNAGTVKNREAAIANWTMGNNGYVRMWGPDSTPRLPSDVIAPYSFLSLDPTAPNAWRIPIDSVQATAGAGGDLPTYMGALPPGPAPKDGDWFTRLQERWLKEPTK